MNPTALANKDKVAKPYNNYNVFFILERELLIHARGSGSGIPSPPPPSPISSSDGGAIIHFMGYDNISLPELPPRYKHLEATLDANWYVAGKKKLTKRKHTKSLHGVATFREIPKIVANNWRAVDPVTKDYIDAVACILKERWIQIPAHLKQVPLKKLGRPKKVKQQTEPREVEESLRTEPEVTSSHFTPNVTPIVVSPSVSASSSSMDFDEFIERIDPTNDDDCLARTGSFRRNSLLSTLGPNFDTSFVESSCSLTPSTNAVDACLKRVDSFNSISSLPSPYDQDDSPTPSNCDANPESIPSLGCGGEINDYCEADISDMDILRLYFTT